MELLVEVMTDLWSGLQEQYVPILNIRFTDFLLAIFVCSAIIATINIINGKHETGSGKD